MITPSEARAIENCIWMTDNEIEAAYAQSSMHGEGSVCDIYLKELESRSQSHV